MDSGITHDILVSYVSADREWGERIAAVLGGKYKVATVEDGATTNPALLGDALSWASRIMPVLSQSSKGSGDAKFWATLRFNASMSDYPRVLPVNIDKVDFGGPLGTTGYINLAAVALDKVDDHLLEAIKAVMER